VDPDGKSFWENHFAKIGNEVGWDQFFEAFNKDYPLTPYLKQVNAERCFEGVLSLLDKGEKVVLASKWKQFVECFGPFSPNQHILHKLLSVMKEPWFFGDLTKEESHTKLRHHGDFLVRFSTTHYGSFILSYLKTGRQTNEISHLQIKNDKGTLIVKKGNKTIKNENLIDVVEELRKVAPEDIISPASDNVLSALTVYIEPE